MFDRFTLEARKTLQLARSECYNSKGGCISTHHILLGLVQVMGNYGWDERQQSLQNLPLSITYEDLKAMAGKYDVKNERNTSAATLPFDSSAKDLLTGAVDNAEMLKHNYIGTEHLWAALMSMPNCSGVKLLSDAKTLPLFPKLDLR